MDKFRINWIERNKTEEITCVSGFDFQVDNWSRDFIAAANKENYSVKKGSRINNSDGTVTITFIKTRIIKDK